MQQRQTERTKQLRNQTMSWRAQRLFPLSTRCIWKGRSLQKKKMLWCCLREKHWFLDWNGQVGNWRDRVRWSTVANCVTWFRPSLWLSNIPLHKIQLKTLLISAIKARFNNYWSYALDIIITRWTLIHTYISLTLIGRSCDRKWP